MEFNYKKILPWVLIVIVVFGIVIWFIFIYRLITPKSLQLISPNGNEIWQANKTYQITWKAKNIEKVGIMLIKDKTPRESEWLVKDFPAREGKYDWQIFAWQEPRQDYKIAIFEYPWYEENEIDYSDKNFTIVGPTFASCDEISKESEWPYLPSDFPNLKKVFITDTFFTGNLGGLEGADQKCQKEANEKGLEGTWKAFLGDDTNLAVERLDLEGIFVEAEGKEVLPSQKIPSYFWEDFSSFLKKTKSEKERKSVEEAYNILDEYFKNFLEKLETQQAERTCHRLLGKNFEEFFKKILDPLVFKQNKLDEKFLKNLSNIWLGRVNNESKRECITVFREFSYSDQSLNYSFTTTCQNWTTSEEKVSGYPPKEGETIELPICYTSEGARITPAVLAGLSLVLTREKEAKFFTLSFGNSCRNSQKLLCIQQGD